MTTQNLKITVDVRYWYLGCGPLTVTVTTRIITFLVGDPYKPSLTTVTVRGPYPIDTYIYHSFHSTNMGQNVGKTYRSCMANCTALPCLTPLFSTQVARKLPLGKGSPKVRYLLGVDPPSQCGKWKPIGIPYWKCNHPGSDWEGVAPKISMYNMSVQHEINIEMDMTWSPSFHIHIVSYICCMIDWKQIYPYRTLADVYTGECI